MASDDDTQTPAVDAALRLYADALAAPDTVAAFAKLLDHLGAPAPWAPNPTEDGSIVDANGDYVLAADAERIVVDDPPGRRDAVMTALVHAAIAAVNHCAGAPAGITESALPADGGDGSAGSPS